MSIILEERGFFWWHEEPVPQGCFAPDSSVTGVLTIEDDGTVSLELDRIMSDKSGLMGFLDLYKNLPDEKRIQGVLKGDGRSVLLLGLTRNGGAIGISYERFSAKNCLVGTKRIGYANEPLEFDALRIELNGFEDWLRLGSININSAGDDIHVEYKKPGDIVYKIDDGILRLEYGLDKNLSSIFTHRASKVDLKERTGLVFKPFAKQSIDSLKEKYRLIGDLLLLLSDSHYSLDWPTLSFESETGPAYVKVYFWRESVETAPPNGERSWVNFIQIRDNFGDILSKWIEKYNDYGPGFYLYLGTRRGVVLYEEHRFVNLVWGIESLHRRMHANEEVSQDVIEKVKRIVELVPDCKDKKWLNGKLKNVGEPALEERISAILKNLPFDFDEKRLNKFATTCAKRRNEISHYGGHKKDEDSATFFTDIDAKSEALSHLYHAILLFEIGISVETLRFRVFESSYSYMIRKSFEAVGLFKDGEVDAEIAHKVAEGNANRDDFIGSVAPSDSPLF